jgi:hypothetical protein
VPLQEQFRDRRGPKKHRLNGAASVLGRFPVLAVLTSRFLVVVDARVIGQAGRAEYFEAGLTTLGVPIAEVGIAIAASA